MNDIQTNHGPMTGKQIVDHLTYCSYAHNRKSMSAEDLATLFPTTAASMERRYQQETKEAA